MDDVRWMMLDGLTLEVVGNYVLGISFPCPVVCGIGRVRVT